MTVYNHHSILTLSFKTTVITETKDNTPTSTDEKDIGVKRKKPVN